MNIETKDEIVLAVLKKMDQRSIIGQQKYGATMMEEIVGQEKDLNRFLIDVQEELMDALLYIEAAKRCLSDEIEEAMLARVNIIGQNGNNGEHYEDEFVNNMSPEEISSYVKMSEKDEMIKRMEVWVDEPKAKSLENEKAV
jgi:hypothetical protein|tara:strand:- start:911 stop:1333 length:423 start_codon:yes stop_codon:yes gene_type:complete